MKIAMDYKFFKKTCLSMVESIIQKHGKVNQIIAISRGGVTAGHIMAKALRLPLAYFFPKHNIITGADLKAFNSKEGVTLIVEDLIAKGRTYRIFKAYMDEQHPDCRWEFCPVVIDHNAPEDINCSIYGIKSKAWIVFPYEDFESMSEGDHGLFRDGTDVYKGGLNG